MTLRKVLIPLLLAGGLLLGACGGPTVLKGTVIGKQYTPEHIYTTTYYMMVGKIMVPMTTTHDDPPQWQIELSNGKDKAWNDVPQYYYAQVQVGNYVNLH